MLIKVVGFFNFAIFSNVTRVKHPTERSIKGVSAPKGAATKGSTKGTFHRR